VEESHRSDFWAAKAIAKDASRLEGENNLGILLVALREEFRVLKPTDDYVVVPLSIPDFTLMGKPGNDFKVEIPETGVFYRRTRSVPTGQARAYNANKRGDLSMIRRSRVTAAGGESGAFPHYVLGSHMLVPPGLFVNMSRRLFVGNDVEPQRRSGTVRPMDRGSHRRRM
jgi:hypothetical protein